MTDLRKAAEMALEFIVLSSSKDRAWFTEKEFEVVAALRQALAQPNDFIYSQNHAFRISPSTGDFGIGSAPAKREWVGLTEEEFSELLYFDGRLDAIEVPLIADLVRAVQAKLKEKNT